MSSKGKSLKSAAFVVVLTVIVFGLFISSQMALGRMHTVGCAKCERYLKVFSATPLTGYVLVLALGVASGFTPCLIALIPVVISLTSGIGRSSRRIIVTSVMSMASGIFYAYLIVPNVMILVPGIIQSLESLATLLALTLMVLGIAHLAEASYSLCDNKCSRSEGREIPVFKTPALIKESIGKALISNNLYVYFLIGVLFSVVELCCTGSLLLVSLPFTLSRPANLLASMILFDAGLIIPTIIVSLSACFIFLRMAQLRALHSKETIVRRIIIGILLIAAGLLLIFF